MSVIYKQVGLAFSHYLIELQMKLYMYKILFYKSMHVLSRKFGGIAINSTRFEIK